MDSCTLTADVTGRQHLWSATQQKLIVSHYLLNGFGRRRFGIRSILLPDSLCDPELSLNTFKRQLKSEDIHFLQNIDDEMYWAY